MSSNVNDFIKEFIPTFESSIEDINQSFRENFQNELKSFKNNDLDELYMKVLSSTVSTLYGKSMHMSLQAIKGYHEWLLKHFELKPKD